MNAGSYLLEGAGTPGDPALLHGASIFTHGEVREAAEKVAAFLRDGGGKKGDRVLLLADSSFFWTSSYLGCLLAGRVAVPLPPLIEPSKAAKIAASTEPSWIFADAKHLARCPFPSLPAVVNDLPPRPPSPLEGGSTSSPSRALSREEGRGEGEGAKYRFEDPPPPAPSLKGRGGTMFISQMNSFSDILKSPRIGPGEPEPVEETTDLAALMFTSGSTGEPRGVMVTHRNLIANTGSVIKYLGLDRHDRMMAVLPFYYCFGTSLLHTHLRAGGSVVIENSFLYPEKVLDRMTETGCTGLAGVPSTFQILLRNSTFRKRTYPHLRHVQQAGGDLPSGFIRELREALPGKKVFIMYGQTEATARLSCLAPDLLEVKMGSIGKGIPGVTIEVLDADGSPVAPGQVGEIVAAGDSITLGYWKAPEETARSFRGGKLYTGDLATVDEEGFIFVAGREKDFIKCAGHRVGCREMEETMLTFPGMIEAAVIGIPDDRLGEAVVLFAAHRRGVNALPELEAFCRANFRWPFSPKRILPLDAIPKNPAGKPDKAGLKKLLDASQPGDP